MVNSHLDFDFEELVYIQMVLKDNVNKVKSDIDAQDYGDLSKDEIFDELKLNNLILSKLCEVLGPSPIQIV